MTIRTETIAVISTSHITHEDADILTAMHEDGDSMSLGASRAGWYANLEWLLANQTDFSSVFIEVIDTVVATTDADWVLFDQDGPTYDELETYDW